MADYVSEPYKTPQDLKDKYLGARTLIIATGNSTKALVKYKHLIRSKFDLVVGLNMATNNFEKELDFRLIVEKKAASFVSDLNSRDYRKTLPYIINWKGINDYPKELSKYKTTRNNFGFSPNIREYKWKGSEGLLIGPPDSKGLSVGSVSCQAIHLACLLGAAKIYLVGCDLVFDETGDHYYGGNVYANSKTKPENRSPIITISFKGKPTRTLEFFYKSAQFIDIVVEKYCTNAGAEVFDFSDGLLKAPQKLCLDDFFK